MNYYDAEVIHELVNDLKQTKQELDKWKRLKGFEHDLGFKHPISISGFDIPNLKAVSDEIKTAFIGSAIQELESTIEHLEIEINDI